MKKWFIVVLIVAFAMIGIVSAAVVATQPIGGGEGYYDITSSPSGAAVTIDGTSIGKTPATAIVMVTGTPGHTINVNLAGYEPWSQYFAGNRLKDSTYRSMLNLFRYRLLSLQSLLAVGRDTTRSVQTQPGEV